jgi:hypothetical protein
MRSRENGGWSFAFDPRLDPRTAPAHWQPDIAPAVLTLVPAIGASAGARVAIDRLCLRSRAYRPADETHLVGDDDRGRHRLLIRGPDAGALALILPVDASMPIRLDAAARLTDHGVLRSAYQPTALQRARLMLFLGILDAEAAGWSKRQIADRMVYSRMRPLHGAAWKASAERRRTIRLWREAGGLRDGGYRELLYARMRAPG